MHHGGQQEGLFFSYTVLQEFHQVPQAERITQTTRQVLKLTTMSPDSAEECGQGY